MPRHKSSTSFQQGPCDHRCNPPSASSFSSLKAQCKELRQKGLTCPSHDTKKKMLENIARARAILVQSGVSSAGVASSASSSMFCSASADTAPSLSLAISASGGLTVTAKAQAMAAFRTSGTNNPLVPVSALAARSVDSLLCAAEHPPSQAQIHTLSEAHSVAVEQDGEDSDDNLLTAYRKKQFRQLRESAVPLVHAGVEKSWRELCQS